MGDGNGSKGARLRSGVQDVRGAQWAPRTKRARALYAERDAAREEKLAAQPPAQPAGERPAVLDGVRREGERPPVVYPRGRGGGRRPGRVKPPRSAG